MHCVRQLLHFTSIRLRVVDVSLHAPSPCVNCNRLSSFLYASRPFMRQFCLYPSFALHLYINPVIFAFCDHHGIGYLLSCNRYIALSLLFHIALYLDIMFAFALIQSCSPYLPGYTHMAIVNVQQLEPDKHASANVSRPLGKACQVFLQRWIAVFSGQSKVKRVEHCSIGSPFS